MLEISLINSQQHLQVLHRSGDLLIGGVSWQNAADTTAPNISQCDATSSSECEFLRVNDRRIADRQLGLRELEIDNEIFVELENFGQSIMLADGKRLHLGGTDQQPLPLKFWIGNTCFHIAAANRTNEKADKAIRTLPRLGAASEPQIEGSQRTDSESLGVAPAAATLQQWFESLGKLQRSIGGSQEFFADAAHAIFDPGGLDSGMVLTREGNEWSIAGSFVPDCEFGFWFRRSVLNRMIQTGQTVFHHAAHMNADDLDSGRTIAVASPIFNEQKQIIGAIYGLRLHHARNNRCGIRPLEAQFVQLLADSVTAGMIRLEREAQAARTQVMFEQVFSPTVARELQRNPRILDGHQRDVTVMFADLQGFTAVSEKLGSKATYHMLGDVMDCLSNFVIEHDGVIIDYFGDGLAAFWNAPLDQPQHATLACRAALAMQNGFADVREDWADLIGHPVQLGIGIHTGTALVGNAGSRRRLKYGPRGATVNIASRIESATRKFHAPILISATTAAAIQQRLITRRVFKTELRGIEQPMDLFELFESTVDTVTMESLHAYKKALAAFESSDLVSARLILADSERLQHDPVSQALARIIDSTAAGHSLRVDD